MNKKTKPRRVAPGLVKQGTFTDANKVGQSPANSKPEPELERFHSALAFFFRQLRRELKGGQ